MSAIDTPAAATRCGSDAGYHRHRRTDETPCADCKRAHADKEARRRQLAPPREHRQAAHGTDSGYHAHKRRGETACDPCLTAHRTYNRTWRDSKGPTP